MYVCMYVWYVCIYVCMYVYDSYTYNCISISIICNYMCVNHVFDVVCYLHQYVRLYICLCLCVYVYRYMFYIFVYVCLYVCVHPYCSLIPKNPQFLLMICFSICLTRSELLFLSSLCSFLAIPVLLLVVYKLQCMSCVGQWFQWQCNGNPMIKLMIPQPLSESHLLAGLI